MTVAAKIGRRNLQADRSASSSAAMLQAAIEVIVEQGSRASMMEIGRRSGFSHGLVLARFGSKASLIKAVTDEVQRGFAIDVAVASEGKRGLSALVAIFDSFFHAFETRSIQSAAFYVLLGEALGSDPDLREAFTSADQTFRGFVESTLKDALKSGEIVDSVTPSAAAVILVGLLRGVTMQLHVNPAAFNKIAVREQLDLFLQAMVKRPKSLDSAVV